MNNDRQITISTAGNHRSRQWPASLIYWSEFITRLSTPVRGPETISQYLALPKSKQDELKDVGGFVGGSFTDNLRKANNVIGRDLVTLDLDSIPAGQTDDVLKRFGALGCGYVTYSTRKHQNIKPRLRLIICLDRTVTSDEYEPIARKLASMIGIELCDPTCFRVQQLMYWPSCSSDSEYVYRYEDKPFLSADGMLSMYKDWRNIIEWPEVPGAQAQVRHGMKQADPITKSGIVGAFCKAYNIYSAIQTFLPEAYLPCDDMPDRLTYAKGSTAGGAVIYENGAFLFSHHATDPAGGKLVNAFDLVRLHLYSELDDEARPDTPTNKLPSFDEMCKLAVADETIAYMLNQERYDKATLEFTQTPPDDPNWIRLLQVNPSSGIPAKTIKNVRVVLENDPNLRGRIRLNRFSNRLVCRGPLPWELRQSPEDFDWTDSDDAGLRGYLEPILQHKSKDIILDALIQTAAKQSFDPVAEYLQSIIWDGQERLDTVFIDYLGADDSAYTRAVCRKALTAAVFRIMVPGIKFDTMTVIDGPQGIGKSTLLAKLGKGWFTDSINTFEGKEASELLAGVWLVEIGELGAYSKSDIRTVKLFLSRTDDLYRAAYARSAERHLRRCVFFGTTNDTEYLRDPSGNRRFWPITALQQKPKKSVFLDLDDNIDQIWGEAYYRYQMGEPLYLSGELEKEAEKRRELHNEQDPLQGQIESFLEKPIPDDWLNWSYDRRLMYWTNSLAPTSDIKLIPRDRICALEVWRECLRDNRSTMPKMEVQRINTILAGLEGWERCASVRFGAGYGRQRGYKRTGCFMIDNNESFVNNAVNNVVLLSTMSKDKMSTMSTTKTAIVDKFVDA